VELRGNLFDGAPGSHGIYCAEDPAPGDMVVIADNRVQNVGTAIVRADGRGTIVSNNLVGSCDRGIDLAGTVASVVSGNVVSVRSADALVNVNGPANVVLGNVTA
jgi:hypothetical protein